jgi:hypothetical protein
MKYFFTFLFIFTTFVLANAIREGTMQARSDGSNVTIQWGSTDEASIKEFEVLRRDGNTGDFISIAIVPKKGSNSFYEYIDKSAFKTTGTIYQYQIKVVYQNSGSEYFPKDGPLTVSHNVSSVKRTWGSLKAMFR